MQRAFAMRSRRRSALVVASLLTNTYALDVVLSERRGSGAARRWRVGDRITPLTHRRPSLRSLKTRRGMRWCPRRQSRRVRSLGVARRARPVRAAKHAGDVRGLPGAGHDLAACNGAAATVAWLSRDAPGMVASLAAAARAPLGRRLPAVAVSRRRASTLPSY